MIEWVGEALKRNSIYTASKYLPSRHVTEVGLAYTHKLAGPPPSSGWNLIFLHLSIGWTWMTPF